MDLKSRLQDDIKTAMRGGDKEKLLTLRMFSAAIKQREVDERIVLDDAQVLAVVEKLIKQRREAAAQYEAGNRPELAAKELGEAALLQSYLPEPLSEADLDALIETAIAENGATGIKEMGRIMAALKPKIQGRADMGAVSSRLKSRLGG
ncbi:MAG TPA: GatB/YqeY domain-containing protein [Candidatus Acidoferrales bacterium]|nr:GatB/YqeY domain-containing protein [Candidatus Acidoferrales bacterium]